MTARATQQHRQSLQPLVVVEQRQLQWQQRCEQEQGGKEVLPSTRQCCWQQRQRQRQQHTPVRGTTADCVVARGSRPVWGRQRPCQACRFAAAAGATSQSLPTSLSHQTQQLPQQLRQQQQLEVDTGMVLQEEQVLVQLVVQACTCSCLEQHRVVVVERGKVQALICLL